MSRRALWGCSGAALAAAVAALGFGLDAAAMLGAWLYAWTFVLGISLGALAILMLHALTGGGWGEPIAPVLAGAVRLMPLVALLATPLLVAPGLVYPWARGEVPAHAQWWYGHAFFVARSLGYLVLWNALAWFWLRARARGTAALLSGPGLILYAFSVSLAANDWLASLVPEWISSGFGLLVAAGQMLAALAFAILLATWRAQAGDEVLHQRCNDLGNLMLMLVLVWAYLAFTQYLIIWSGNLPREISWYLPRLQTNWEFLGAFLIAFHFFIPLAILLSRAVKRAPRTLAALAGLVLAVHLADAWWLVAPSLHRAGFRFGLYDIAALASVLGIWAVAWLLAWPARPLAIREETAHG